MTSPEAAQEEEAIVSVLSIEALCRTNGFSYRF